MHGELSLDVDYVVELQQWLENVRSSLQKTMEDVDEKLAGMKKMTCLKKNKAASEEIQASVPGAITEEPVFQEPAPNVNKAPGEERTEQAWSPPETRVDCGTPLSKASQLTASSKSLGSAPEKAVAHRKDWSCWFKDLLLRCVCDRRQKSNVPKAYTFQTYEWWKEAQPTHLFLYTKDENDATSLGKKLKQSRKSKLVPTSLWTPRLQIVDASDTSHELKTIEDHKDCSHMHFPVRVAWHWLSPDELPQGDRRDKIWWKVMGLFANNELRKFSMVFHARMRIIDINVKMLAKAHHKDQERALENRTSLEDETQEAEMELAIDTLRDIDDLLRLDFRCDGHKYTFGEVAEAGSCSWEAFLESYMNNRNDALNCKTDQRRRDLIGAAIKGTDGLELLYQQMVHRIDDNDLMVFKFLVIFVNSLTALAQFFWSDYIVPRVKDPPKWQQQIAEIAASTSGG